jgi:Domain of unknown function (DUF5916)
VPPRDPIAGTRRAPCRRARAGAYAVLVLGSLQARGLADPPAAAPVAEAPASEPAAGPLIPPTLQIQRRAGPIAIDGVLDDAGWLDIAPIDEWFETNPGNNTVPQVQNRGRLTYDGEALYVGLELHDPDPGAIRAAVTDRDNVTRESDSAGVIMDPTDSGHAGQLFLVNPRGVQSDSVLDDHGNGEDPSPDFFWDSAVQITDKGWTLEIRIPFSSFSYSRQNPQPFRLMLYRNYPRKFRYQFFTTQLPRDSGCVICRCNRVVGLADLPAGGGIVIAPYLSGSYEGEPAAEPGAKLDYGDPRPSIGFDAKWRPAAGTVLDVTVNPDFSQIESDVALITANERFALSYPEKRPFFLEGVELLATPIAAVSTRSLTAPQWGARATFKGDALAFTALAAQDEGGGQVILPGATSSTFAAQDFRSWATIARLRYQLGRFNLGALVTTRDVEGGGAQRVGGFDLQWHPSESDQVVGQLLYSATRTPDRPDLAAAWDGGALAGHAASLRWIHTGSVLDIAALYRDLGSEFRADNGFVPQVGIREGRGEAGLTMRPDDGALRRLRSFATYGRIADTSFDLLSQGVAVGTVADAALGSTAQLHYAYDQILVTDKLLSSHKAVYNVSMTPAAVLSRIDVSGSAGQQIDFDNARTGTGFDVALAVKLRPTPHLELEWNEGVRWLDVDVSGQARSRLFTARIDRLRVVYSFTPRVFVRVTGQYEVTRRSPELYMAPIAAEDSAFTGSALFAYKINWQSVVFVGYGDNRTLSAATQDLELTGRQVFVKLSHAFQW